MGVAKLRQFKVVSQFKKIALSLAAQLLSDEDIREMQRTFIQLDKDNDGVLSQVEISEGLASRGLTLPPDLGEILESIDTDGSGCIDNVAQTVLAGGGPVGCLPDVRLEWGREDIAR